MGRGHWALVLENKIGLNIGWSLFLVRKYLKKIYNQDHIYKNYMKAYFWNIRKYIYFKYINYSPYKIPFGYTWLLKNIKGYPQALQNTLQKWVYMNSYTRLHMLWNLILHSTFYLQWLDIDPLTIYRAHIKCVGGSYAQFKPKDEKNFLITHWFKLLVSPQFHLHLRSYLRHICHFSYKKWSAMTTKENHNIWNQLCRLCEILSTKEKSLLLTFALQLSKKLEIALMLEVLYASVWQTVKLIFTLCKNIVSSNNLFSFICSFISSMTWQELHGRKH